MQELTLDEIQEVNGGLLPVIMFLVGLNAGVWLGVWSKD
jgi:lactobin A/cerein 7B family class IIb bacteriocin